MIKAALDANVIVAGVRGLTRDVSTPGIILRRLYAGHFLLVTSQHILTEVTTSIDKPYFRERLTPYEIEEIRLFLVEEAEFIPISVEVQGVATHAEDDLVLATAVSGDADYLVTGDKGLLNVGSYRGVTIVTPRVFLDILDHTANLP